MSDFDVCPDCSVAIGRTHLSSCDISRCKIHGVQLFKCLLIQESDKCSPTKFDGFFPGTQEAIERAWYVFQNDAKKWERCSSDNPDASPDINRVISELTWDSQLEKYV